MKTAKLLDVEIMDLINKKTFESIQNADTAIRHTDHEPAWEDFLKYGGDVQILLVCIDFANSCEIGQPENQCVGYCNQNGG